MALDYPSSAQAEGQSHTEADERDDLPPIDNTVGGGVFQPVDRWRDHQGACDDQARREHALAKPASPSANRPVREHKSNQQEIDEVECWHRTIRLLGRSDEHRLQADRGSRLRALECIT